jgi:hypothetical protein
MTPLRHVPAVDDAHQKLACHPGISIGGGVVERHEAGLARKGRLGC